MRVIGAVVLILLLTPTAHAGAWYLMAADAKVVSNPSVADRLHKGAVLGPLELISQGEFSSREDCEPSRDQLIAAWRKQGLMIRGGWDKYGIRGPGEFIRCVPDIDPHLTKSTADDRAKGTRSLEILLRNKRGR
jgi:hypothetical protein